MLVCYVWRGICKSVLLRIAGAPPMPYVSRRALCKHGCAFHGTYSTCTHRRRHLCRPLAHALRNTGCDAATTLHVLM